ncbi:MAG: hypothetical protein BZ136_05990 [Methanosphaera sp. rholeuAM74]|nr:MAG: hypothetical protein BZ136_05990 [Methanosphaera sp. rholeuAM74]
MINKIRDEVDNCHNVLVYSEDLYLYYNKFDTNDFKVYISTPKNGKNAFESILKSVDKTENTNNKTISKLIELTIKKTGDKRLVLFIDNFQQLTRRELNHYKELEKQENICIVANMTEDKDFIDEEFLDNFTILSDEFYNNRSQSVNIKYTILLLLSLLIFILFLKLQLGTLRLLVNTLWFTLLMYRTFYYFT